MNFIRNRLGTKLFHNFERSKSNFSFLISRLQIVLWIFSREETKKQRRKDGERGKKTHERARKRVNEHARRKRTLQDKSWSRVSQPFFTTRRCFIRNIFNYFERFRRASERNEWNTFAIRRANSSQRWFDDRGVMDRSKFSNLI